MIVCCSRKERREEREDRQLKNNMNMLNGNMNRNTEKRNRIKIFKKHNNNEKK